MTRIIIDQQLKDKLRNLDQPAELCDESGHILGQFLPAFNPEAYEGLEPPISEEEIQARIKSKGKTYSTAEVLAHLEKL
jgi:hypothetical protein